MNNFAMKLTNVTITLSHEHSGFIWVTLNGTNECGQLTKFSFTADKTYQLTALCEYLGYESFNEMDSIPNIPIAVYINGNNDAVAISKNTIYGWLFLPTGKMLSKKIIDTIIEGSPKICIA